MWFRLSRFTTICQRFRRMNTTMQSKALFSNISEKKPMNSFLNGILKDACVDQSKEKEILKKYKAKSHESIILSIFKSPQPERIEFFRIACKKISAPNKFDKLYLTKLMQNMIFHKTLLNERKKYDVLSDFEEVFDDNEIVDLLLNSKNSEVFSVMSIYLRETSRTKQEMIYSRFVASLKTEKHFKSALKTDKKLRLITDLHKKSSSVDKNTLFELFVTKVDFILKHTPNEKEHRQKLFKIVSIFKSNPSLSRSDFKKLNKEFMANCAYYRVLKNASRENLNFVLNNKDLLHDDKFTSLIGITIKNENSKERMDQFLKLILDEMSNVKTESEMNLLLQVLFCVLNKESAENIETSIWTKLESIMLDKIHYILKANTNRMQIKNFLEKLTNCRKEVHVLVFRVWVNAFADDEVVASKQHFRTMIHLLFKIEKNFGQIFNEHYMHLFSSEDILSKVLKQNIRSDIFREESVMLIDDIAAVKLYLDQHVIIKNILSSNGCVHASNFYNNVNKRVA